MNEDSGPRVAAPALEVEPFLHYGPERIYNTLTDRFLNVGEAGFHELKSLREGQSRVEDLSSELASRLVEGAWLVESSPTLGARYLLKYVSLEASTVCNQGCYFCPVSIDRREVHSMSMEMYENVVSQVSAYRDTIEGVSMILYNEPTADKRFVDQVRVLKKYGLPPAVLTNGTGLTPDRVDKLLEFGGLKYLSVNLSTLDRERYKRDRDGDHLPLVLRNLDYLKDKQLAPQMDMAVLGTGDEVHRQDYEDICARFAGSKFTIHFYKVMNRAGAVPIGMHPEQLHENLRGCEQTGSRPVQWIHINPLGQCVLCCQDYHEDYVVGDLREESLDAILTGPKISLLRRWVYGADGAPDDFICRRCIYALS